MANEDHSRIVMDEFLISSHDGGFSQRDLPYGQLIDAVHEIANRGRIPRERQRPVANIRFSDVESDAMSL